MPIVDNAAALTEFARLVQPDVCPVLTAAEQQAILDRHRRGTVWTANRVTQLGDVVIPMLPSRNGYRYVAVRYASAGTDQKTGTVEPSWPTTRDSEVTDDVVVWREAGSDWNAVLWDFIAAAREGWEEKMAKASPTSDVQTDALAIKSSQLFEHCKAMAEKFSPVYVL